MLPELEHPSWPAEHCSRTWNIDTVIDRALGYSQSTWWCEDLRGALVNINCEKTCKCKYNSVGTENSKDES